MIIKGKAYPRIGLIGNPSDGYYGKTIAMTFKEFCAEVLLYESPELEILPNTRDHSIFKNIKELVDDVARYGYYGGIRLLKAAIKKFWEYCVNNGIELPEINFTLRYRSDIPHMVGLGGSSAIVTAAFRAMVNFFKVNIPKPILANIILSVEMDELGISAGLQDRVAQVYNGIVYMDFSKDIMEKYGYGRYEYINVNKLPNFYMAYRPKGAGGSEKVHNPLRTRFLQGDPVVKEAIEFWRKITDEFRDALLSEDYERASRLMDMNFDKRCQVCYVNPRDKEMIEVVRDIGASGKLTGSGGAIVGIYKDEMMFEELKKRLKNLDEEICIVKPTIVESEGETS